jgi:hypothetical protein
MSEMACYDEERLAWLLSMLPPAPEAWVCAAKELPLARFELADVPGAVAESAFRADLQVREESVELADVEAHGRPGPAVENTSSESASRDASETGKDGADETGEDSPSLPEPRG